MPYDTDLSRTDVRAAHPPATHTLPMLTVLLIEDSVLLKNLLGSMLEEMDEVSFRGSAEGEREALDKLEHDPVDLVIVDIELKQGSGIGVLSALLADPDRYGNPLKVVLSNYAHATMQQRCERLGANAFFDKSLNVGDMFSYIRAAAAKKSS